MTQVQTIKVNDSKIFDQELNAALAEGFVIEGAFGVGDYFYAFLKKDVDDTPDADKAVRPEEKKVLNQPDDNADPRLSVEMVDRVMKFIKWCCDRSEYCPECPLYHTCHCELPFNWNVDGEED